jgi:hypothetical protein
MAVGTGCTVPVGGTFTVRAHLDTFAGASGYIVFEFRLLFSNPGLTRVDRAGFGELGTPMYWDKTCDSFMTEVPNPGNYFINCWSNTPVSVYERDEADDTPDGKLVEVDFSCASAGQRTVVLDNTSQVHNSGHGSLFDKDGDETLLINCKGAADDTDGDTVANGTDTNDDNDGCVDAEEQGQNKGLGGLRNPHNFWDFFDTPTGMSLTRDQSIAGTDFFALLGRFGASGSTLIDPLSTPAAAPAYHTAYDRGGAGPPFSWSLLPADGSIAGTDFFALLGQFGDTCAGPP